MTAVFYVAHRLFAAHDRQLGALVASRIARQTGPDAVFLPFCDTDEEDLIADVKGRRLYELDTQRLASLTGMLAILHGPSLDDGVCMEIGYAAALGVPVVILTTDFVTHGPTEHGPSLCFPDPLVETLAADVIRAPRLAPASGPRSDPYVDFQQRNARQLAGAIDAAVARMLTHAASSRPDAPAPDTTDRIAFCEPSPYWNDPSWTHLIHQLQHDGYRTRHATRLQATDPLAAARTDWTNATNAGLLLVDVSGPETPPGAALLIGANAARRRRTLASHHTLSWTFAHGREPNWRNLMIQYAVHDRLRNSESAPSAADP